MRGAADLVLAMMLAGGLMATDAAAAPSSSADPSPTALVLRGSTPAAAHDTTASDGDAPTVLRGSPPSIVRAYSAPFSCPPGFDYEADIGCLPPSSPAYGPDYSWWPYDWFGGFDGGLRNGLRRGLAHAKRSGRSFRLGRQAFGGFHPGFSHSAGLGRR
jgi:hypothetical protein